MAAIVAMHSLGGFAVLAGADPLDRFTISMLQPFKFGTIGFFLISGFLMGEGLTRRSASDYITRRVKTVLAPWFAWFSMYFVAYFAYGIADWHFPFGSLHQFISFALNRLHTTLFGTAYWFVPNLLLGVCILLLCRRFLYDLRLGGALLALSVSYGLNTHFNWLTIKGHTEALLGFVFYLWLGAWTARNIATFEKWMAGISLQAIIAVSVISCFAALHEATTLAAAGSQYALDTLRVSNQVYSVAVVLLIFKLRKSLAPPSLNVRATTFGIYLTHTIVLAFLLHAGKFANLPSLIGESGRVTGTALVALLVGAFFATYSLSLFRTECLLAHTHLRWAVGGDALAKVPRSDRGVSSLEQHLLPR